VKLYRILQFFGVIAMLLLVLIGTLITVGIVSLILLRLFIR
jgi:hypothetical protein